MGKKLKRITALFIAIAMCVSFATVASAYVDNYPNTHRNTGHHIADLIAVARTQLGYTELSTKTGLPLSPSQDGGYTKYGESFGNSTGAWCAYFVSWCARQAGIPTSIVPRLGNCAATVKWYKSHSNFYTPETGYIPKTGDIIFYNWSGAETAKHIGIITGVSGNTIYTIEGNTDSSLGYRCAGKVRSRTASYIVGYGVPAYNDASTYVGSYSFAASLSGQNSSKSQSIAYNTSRLAVITTSATEITSENATLHGEIQNSGRLRMASAGFYFGLDKLAMKRYQVSGATSKADLELTMDVKSKVGNALTPNTVYYYQTYTSVDGRDYLGPTYAVVTVNDKPQKLVLSENEVNVGVGQTAEIMAAQLPLGSKDEGITWKSANEEIATVSDSVIKGVGYGKVIVTATTNYGNVSSQCIVNVLIPAPQNARLVNISEEKITIEWDAVDGAKGYVLYRAESADSKFEEYKKLSSDKTSFVDSSLEKGKRYYYRLSTLAKDEKYNSDPTDTLYTTAKLAAPQKLTASSFLAASVRLTWGEVEGAKAYSIYRSANEDGLYRKIGTVGTTDFVDSDIDLGDEYFYKVVAENGNTRTISDYSEIAAVLTEPYEIGFECYGFKLDFAETCVKKQSFGFADLLI